MKKIYLIISLLSFVSVVMYGQTTVLEYTSWGPVSESIWNSADGSISANLEVGTQTESGTGQNITYTPADTAKLVVNGALIDDKKTITVSAGSTLIVYGDLSLVNTNSKLYGNIIVTGTTTLKNSDILGSSNLISLGTVTYETTGGGSDGQVFPIPPATTNEEGEVSSIEELLAEMGDGTPEGDLLAELIESVPEVIETVMDSNPATNVATWDGSSNTNWSETTNWVDNALPGDYASVTINNVTNDPEDDNADGDGELKVGELILSAGATLNVPDDLYVVGDLIMEEGCQLTVGGNLTVLGAFVVNNTTTNPSSIKTNPARTVTADVTIRWSYDALRYWFVGHSIANPTMATYRNILVDDPTQKYVLFDYVDGRLHNRAVTPADFEFTTGDELRGFQFKALKALTLEHTGTLNNAAVYQKDVQAGWQIIANPYPAYYQVPVDNGDFAETEGTIYVTSATSNADKTYDVFNTDSGLGSSAVGDPFDGVIAPSQAFYVKTVDTPSAGAKITMSANNCTNSSSTPELKSEIKTNNTILRLKLSNEYGLSDEAVVALFDNGDFSFTRQDSKQLMYNNTNYSYIYSLVDDAKTVINVLPQSVDNYEQVIGIQTKAGKQKLSIGGIKELGKQYTLLLEDKQAGITTVIGEDESYVFEAEEGVEHDRFVLHFKASKPNTPTDIDNAEGDTESVIIYVHDKSTLKISCGWSKEHKIVEIYSVSGELVANEMFDGEEFDYELNLLSGVYIVRVIFDDLTYEQKVFVE